MPLNESPSSKLLSRGQVDAIIAAGKGIPADIPGKFMEDGAFIFDEPIPVFPQSKL